MMELYAYGIAAISVTTASIALVREKRVERAYVALHVQHSRLAERLKESQAAVGKWSGLWGNTSRLLGIAERSNKVLMSRVLRFEQETGE